MLQSNLMLNILLLAFLWGPSFLFIKIAVTEVQPITLVAIRISLSALVLLAFLKIKKIQLPRDLTLWKHCFVMGFIASSLPFVLYGYSLGHIDSILSALINGTTPISTVFLAHYCLTNERLTLNRVVGIGLGLMGFLVLFIPSLLDGDAAGDSLGMLFSLLAAACYAVGMVYARKYIRPPSQPLVLPTLQFLTSLIYLIPLSLLIDPPFHPEALSATFWGSVLTLSISGTVFAFIVYYKILIRYGAIALSTTTYLLPLFSTLFGVIFLKESLTLPFCLAAILILLGIMVANGLIRMPILTRLSTSPIPLKDKFPADK